MTALVASQAKAFRDIGAFMMRCPHKPSDSHDSTSPALAQAQGVFLRERLIWNGGDSHELGTD